jgi:hypothetical protein
MRSTVHQEKPEKFLLPAKDTECIIGRYSCPREYIDTVTGGNQRGM